MKKLVGEGKPLYSAVDKAAKGLKRKVGTGAEFMKELMGITGIKPTEINERGLNEVMGMPRMTHDQFMANLAIRPTPAIGEKVLGGDPDHPDWIGPYHYQWSLPGGENYREMLIKLPDQRSGMDEKRWELDAKLRHAAPENRSAIMRQIDELKDKYEKTPEVFEGVGSHFGGEPGIIASMRLKDRTGPNGEKLLHLEELQSDWHQQGREHGYKQNLTELPQGYTVRKNINPQGFTDHSILDENGRLFASGVSAEGATRNAIENLNAGKRVPDAPFKKNWEEMALKRLIHHAAEKGYHGVVVTPGKEQAERYNIGNHIGYLGYHPEEERLKAYGHDRREVMNQTGIKKEDLPNHIGKEVADRLLKAPQVLGTHQLEGENIHVGGKGMKGFYDTKVPNILNSIGKKYGVKTQLGGHRLKGSPEDYGNAVEKLGIAHIPMAQLTPEQNQKIAETADKRLHHFPITEEMRKDVLTNGLPLYSQGGTVHMAEGGDMDQMQLALMNKQLGMYKAADRAKAGKMAAEAIKQEPEMKASEALGQLREKGFKRTTTTQADRTRVGGGNIGGAAFPAISNVDPEYAGKAWGVMDTGTAARLTNLTNPETAWTTMLGSATQLKTNPIVFDKLKRQFQAAMKQGLLSPELQAKINHNLSLTFGAGADIRDPNIWKMADTFEKRAALADLMMGQGIAPGKGGVALGGEKSGKGVIFKPTQTLMQETEPGLHHPEHGGNVPTFAAGPRLFQLEKEASYRPDLHPGFPMLIHGKDLGKRIKPVPTETYLPDWHKAFKKSAGGRKPGYYDLALGVKGQGLPSQELTDAYIRHLMTEGFKRGGAVRMADGGQVDVQNIGVEEAPDMDVKQYFMPRPMTTNSFPVGGVQQPPQAPQQMQQQPQAPQGMPQGQAPFQPQAQPPQPPSNILQMTRQGQAMNAIKPPQMARGGHVDRDTMMLELMNRKTKVKHGR